MINVKKFTLPALILCCTLSFTANAQLSSLSQGDMGSALKLALSNGVQKGCTQLSQMDGFFKNAAIKILMPPEATNVESKLRQMGFGPQVDQLILSMNRAAEQASASAANIFLNAITQMSISDAQGLLTGGDTAATHYLRTKTTLSLTIAFKPTIDTALTKTHATTYWKDVFGTYNKVPFTKKVNPDLVSYVTSKALDGIFYEIAQEEKAIRANPAGQASALLSKVFGSIGH